MTQEMNFVSLDKIPLFTRDAKLLNELDEKQYELFLNIINNGEKILDYMKEYSLDEVSKEISDILEYDIKKTRRLIRFFGNIMSDFNRDDPKNDFLSDLKSQNIDEQRYEIIIDNMVKYKEEAVKHIKYREIAYETVPYLKSYGISVDVRYEINNEDIVTKAPLMLVSLKNSDDTFMTFQMNYYDADYFIKMLTENLHNLDIILEKEGIKI